MVELKNYFIMWMDEATTIVNDVSEIIETPDGLILDSPNGKFYILDKSKVRFITKK